LFLFVFIYYNNEILGQDNLSMQDDYYNATIMSPQSYAFTQYGNHTPELARGEVSVRIPLYTYKDRNFEIPIEYQSKWNFSSKISYDPSSIKLDGVLFPQNTSPFYLVSQKLYQNELHSYQYT